MGIDEEFVGFVGSSKGKVSVFAGGEDSPQEDAFARASADVEGNRSDESARHAGLMKSAAHLKALFGAMRRKIHLVARDSGAAHILLKKPIHGVPPFQIHPGSHDGFHFALELSGAERGLRVFCAERAEQGDEARVGIAGIGLAQHFADHMKYPSSFGIDDNLVSLGRLGRGEAGAHDEWTNIGGGDVFFGGLGSKPFAVALQPSAESVIGILL